MRRFLVTVMLASAAAGSSCKQAGAADGGVSAVKDDTSTLSGAAAQCFAQRPNTSVQGVQTASQALYQCGVQIFIEIADSYLKPYTSKVLDRVKKIPVLGDPLAKIPKEFVDDLNKAVTATASQNQWASFADGGYWGQTVATTLKNGASYKKVIEMLQLADDEAAQLQDLLDQFADDQNLTLALDGTGTASDGGSGADGADGGAATGSDGGNTGGSSGGTTGGASGGTSGGDGAIDLGNVDPRLANLLADQAKAKLNAKVTAFFKGQGVDNPGAAMTGVAYQYRTLKRISGVLQGAGGGFAGANIQNPIDIYHGFKAASADDITKAAQAAAIDQLADTADTASGVYNSYSKATAQCVNAFCDGIKTLGALAYETYNQIQATQQSNVKLTQRYLSLLKAGKGVTDGFTAGAQVWGDQEGGISVNTDNVNGVCGKLANACVSECNDLFERMGRFKTVGGTFIAGTLTADGKSFDEVACRRTCTSVAAQAYKTKLSDGKFYVSENADCVAKADASGISGILNQDPQQKAIPDDLVDNPVQVPPDSDNFMLGNGLKFEGSSTFWCGDLSSVGQRPFYAYYTCHGALNQQFSFGANNTIVSRDSGQCLTIFRSTRKGDSFGVGFAYCSPDRPNVTQEWEFVASNAGDPSLQQGFFFIRSIDYPYYVLDADTTTQLRADFTNPGNSEDDAGIKQFVGAVAPQALGGDVTAHPIQAYRYNGAANQLWRVAHSFPNGQPGD